jgi:hypothetical protein
MIPAMPRAIVLGLLLAVPLGSSCCPEETDAPAPCEVYGCPCSPCPPPETVGEVMCGPAGDEIAYMIADSAACADPPAPGCFLGSASWACEDGTVTTPWCCPWP